MALEVQFIIAGSTLNQSGFSSIAQYGNYTEDDINVLDSWRLTENPSFRIKHTPNFISYALRETRFLASDGNRQNRMTIEIRIAANKILANNVSPYTLLKDMYTELTEHYAEKTPDGKLRFKPSVNDMDAVTAHFREIIKKYPVEDRRGSYIKMKTGDNITGFVCLTDEQKEMFFRDTQYPEFANYSQIEIGKECAGLVHRELQNLEIPREIRFEVYEGNKSTGKILTNPSTKCPISKRATEEKEYTPCEFSLQELFEAHGGILRKDGATIEIDYIKSRITCRLAEKDIMYTVSVVYDGNAQENAKNLFKSGRKKMFFNDDDLTFLAANGGTKEYPASKVLQWDRPTLEPGITDGFKFNVFHTKGQFDKTFKIRINVSKQEKPKTTSFPAAGASTKKASLGYNDDDSQTDISDSEPIGGNGFNLKSALIGLGIGLLLGCGIMTALYYLIPLQPSSDSAARTQLLDYAINNKDFASSEEDKSELNELVKHLRGKDKDVKTFFDNNIDDNAKKGDINSIRRNIKNNAGWVDLYLAAKQIDSVLKVQTKVDTKIEAKIEEKVEEKVIGEEQSKPRTSTKQEPKTKTVFDLMPTINNGLKKVDFEKCSDWSSIYQGDFKNAFDLFDGSTDYKVFKDISSTKKLKEKAEQACREKIKEGINTKIKDITEDGWTKEKTRQLNSDFQESSYYKYVAYYDKTSMIANFFNCKWGVLETYLPSFKDISEIENASKGKKKGQK